MSQQKISHSFQEESVEEKARWFQNKSRKERLLTALEWIIFINSITKKSVTKDDYKTFKSVQILERR